MGTLKSSEMGGRDHVFLTVCEQEREGEGEREEETQSTAAAHKHTVSHKGV
jgi:hypothetical protein